MKKFLIYFGMLFWLILQCACSHRYSYIPSVDSEMQSGHLALFSDEISSGDSGRNGAFEPAVITVTIIQEGRTIISDELTAGSWNLYPVPEGVYLVDLKTEYSGQPVTLTRPFTSKIGLVNVLYVEFWRVEPVIFQTNEVNYTGAAAQFILNSKRTGKTLGFDDVRRFDAEQ